MEIVKTIGSGSSNDFVIAKPGIIETHAQITYAPGYFMMVEDLGSTMGTFVNNQRIKGKKVLKPGDILCFGDVLFHFDEHYPEMLKTLSVAPELDAGLEGVEPDDALSENDAREEETLSGLKGLKRFIYTLQFPKDRQLMQRIWFIVMASVIFITMVIPWFSWSNPTGATILEDEKYDAMSGFGMFYELMDVQVSGAPVLYILLFGIMMLIFFGTLTAMICYFLIGFKAWKPKNMLGIRRLSQTVLVLFGINFLLQFMRYVGYWYDGENSLVIETTLSGSGINEARLYIEYLGIGYWLCGFAILMVLRSTRNGLWRPNFSRKWATLSFSFWLPMVLLLVTVHQGAGVLQRHMDINEYKKLWGSSYKSVFDDKELKERVTANGPGLANVAYIELIREKKREDSGQRRLRGTAIADDFISKRKTYMSGIWLSLHGLLIVSLIQLFRRRIRGTATLVNSVLLLTFTISLAVFVFFFVDLIQPRLESNVELSVGYGCFLAILAALGMVSEQFIFWSKRNEKGAIGKSEEMIDDVV